MHVIVNGAAWIDHGWGLAGMERLQYRRDRADVDYRVLCSDCEADPPLRPALVAKFRVLSERPLLGRNALAAHGGDLAPPFRTQGGKSPFRCCHDRLPTVVLECEKPSCTLKVQAWLYLFLTDGPSRQHSASQSQSSRIRFRTRSRGSGPTMPPSKIAGARISSSLKSKRGGTSGKAWPSLHEHSGAWLRHPLGPLTGFMRRA